MRTYEGGSSAYFATPPTNLVYALHTALSALTKGGISMEERFRLHKEASAKVRGLCTELGLKMVRTVLDVTGHYQKIAGRLRRSQNGRLMG
jgi:alanine-glyoxylate transaminase / serine-glyoxylate transaminase / serine-pyruvate transaminase